MTPETRLKYLCEEPGQYGLNVPASDYVSAQEGVRLLRTTDLRPDGLLPEDEGIFAPPPVDARFLLRESDILLSRSGTIGRSFLVPREGAGMSFAGFLVRYRPNERADPRFLNYALQSGPVQRRIHTDAVASTIQNFNAERYANLKIPNPPLEEQRRIAHFLDEQVALLDRAIALRQQQRDLLAQRLQSRIDEIDQGDAPLVKAGFLLRVLPGFAFPSDEFSADQGLRLLRGVNVGIRRIRWSDCVRWTERDPAIEEKFSLSEGDVVMGMDRPWIAGGLRIATLSEADTPSLLLQRVARLRPCNQLEPRYMYWAYQARRFRDEVEGELTGLSVPHLSGEQIRSHRIRLPDLPTQRVLDTQLDELEADAVLASTLMKRSEALITERKEALITAAVTGEFDVTTARSVA